MEEEENGVTEKELKGERNWGKERGGKRRKEVTKSRNREIRGESDKDGDLEKKVIIIFPLFLFSLSFFRYLFHPKINVQRDVVSCKAGSPKIQ